MKPHVLHMTQFVEHIAGDEDASDGVIAASCGLIGYEHFIHTATSASLMSRTDRLRTFVW